MEGLPLHPEFMDENGECSPLPQPHGDNLAFIASMKNGDTIKDRDQLVALLDSVEFGCTSIPTVLNASITEHGHGLKKHLKPGWTKDELSNIFVTREDMVEGIGQYLRKKEKRFRGGLAKASRSRLEEYIKKHPKILKIVHKMRDSRVAYAAEDRRTHIKEYRSWKPGQHFTIHDGPAHWHDVKTWCVVEHHRTGIRCVQQLQDGHGPKRHFKYITLMSHLARLEK